MNQKVKKFKVKSVLASRYLAVKMGRCKGGWLGN